LWLPNAEAIATQAKVIQRKRDNDGQLIGHSYSNPLLDTSLYDVGFDDGRVGTYSANIIAQKIFEQVDSDGHVQVIFNDIIDHRKGTDAVPTDDGLEVYNNHRVPKCTTRGWSLLVQWKEGTTTWLPLKDLKESNPVQVADYAVAHKLVHEPAFAWWVPYVLKKRDRIIKQALTRYQRTDQKFGIEIPKTVKCALQIDKETNTTFWRDALTKKMGGTEPVIDILPEGSKPPVGFTGIPFHMIFDVKMDFTRKARLVAGCHVTSPHLR
jgi:hypothetical protein